MFCRFGLMFSNQREHFIKKIAKTFAYWERDFAAGRSVVQVIVAVRHGTHLT